MSARPLPGTRPLHIVPVLPWLVRGGTEGQVARLSQRWQAAGHRVTVIAGEDGPWRTWLAAHAVPVLVVPPYVRKGLHSRTGRASNLYAILWLARRFRQLQPDVVSAFLYPVTYLSVIAARLAGVPVRLTNYRNVNYWRARQPLPRWVERAAYRCLTGAVANSHTVAQDIQQTEGLPPDALTVIYNGVDVPADPDGAARAARRARGFGADTVVVGMLANFQPEKKDHLHLLRAVRAVVAQAPDLRVRLGGRPSPYRDTVQQAIYDWQLAQVVQIETVTNPGDFVAALDIGVLCSRKEGLSNAVLEYMAYGKPVIATRIGPHTEVIRPGETGYLVAVGDDDALADALLALRRDPARRAQMGQAGRADVQARFTWERAVAQWMALFDRQLAGHRERVR